jgi:hypothetical protein
MSPNGTGRNGGNPVAHRRTTTTTTNMKLAQIITALRNTTSPQASLAAWHSVPLYTRRKQIAGYYASAANLAIRRAEKVNCCGLEMSLPTSETPFLWISEDSPEVLDFTAGRACLKHRGWYTDAFCEDTIETYAVILARFPRLVFYAVQDSCNEALRVDLSEFEEIDYDGCGSEIDAEDSRFAAMRKSIRANDHTTEREAEKAQEYYRKDQIEQGRAGLREELAALRSEISAVARELKKPGNRATPEAPLVRAACAHLQRLLQDRRDMIQELKALAA